MADFLHSYSTVLKNEGGFSNVKGDIGQLTYCGISRHFFPNWQGWPVLDKYMPLEQGEVIQDATLSGMVKQFYKTNFWDRIGGDGIHSQLVADFCFDFVVNSGGAVKVIQTTVGATPDGKFGTATLTSINARDEHELMTKLKAARIAYVNNIVKNDPSQKKFLQGWVNRINSF